MNQIPSDPSATPFSLFKSQAKQPEFEFEPSKQNIIQFEGPHSAQSIDWSAFRTSKSQQDKTPQKQPINSTPILFNLQSTAGSNMQEAKRSYASQLASRINFQHTMEVEPNHKPTFALKPLNELENNFNVKRNLPFLEDSGGTPKKVCLTSPSNSFTPVKRNLFGIAQQERMNSESNNSSGSRVDLESMDDDNESRFQTEYLNLDTLGSGNFGKVYKCQNIYDNQIYAIKFSNQKGRQQSDKIEAVNEAQALAYLSAQGNCPYIIRYYTSWREGNALYIAMEYCDASLTQIRKNKQEQNLYFQEAEIAKILREISEGLRYLHSNDIVHLDIKPDNLLYSSIKGVYKIADLGLSRVSKIRKGEDLREGDSRYLALDILKDAWSGQDVYELSKADIFSLGISIYELMKNSDLPKCEEEWTKLREEPELDFGPNEANYSRALKQLIARMMHVNSQMRPSAAEILDDEYFRMDKENRLKWEKVRGQIYRKELEDLMRPQPRKNSA